MPTYDYVCKTCGKPFEYFQSIKADKLTLCPLEVCEEELKGEGEVERKIGAGAGLIFNGDGFYLTDYARSGKTKSPASGSKDKQKQEKTSPAAKSDASSDNGGGSKDSKKS